jgi:uncharacterized SAM-binding protein YcdF (DUF218 family)
LRVRWRFFFAIFFLLIAGIIATSQAWLSAAGRFLIDAESPRQAQAALVLAGDWRGNRILHAAHLVQLGYVPKVYVSGPMKWYGLSEATAAIEFAQEKGHPREAFEALEIQAHSTEDEANALLPEIRKRGVSDLLVVTSNYHTRRSLEIFRHVFPKDIRVSMIAAPDPFFDAASWWHHREGQKIFFYEASKTVAEWVGL